MFLLLSLIFLGSNHYVPLLLLSLLCSDYVLIIIIIMFLGSNHYVPLLLLLLLLCSSYVLIIFMG